MKICFHVNNSKISHKIPTVVGKTTEWIRLEYKRISEDGSEAMSVSQGKINKYLGMTMDHTVSGISRISILEYIDNILTAFDKMDPSNSSTKSSVATENLFKVDKVCEKLSPDKAKVFHNLVDKTIYTIKRGRLDTHKSVAFLTISVREPDTYDWKKLAHLIKYLIKTRNIPLIMGASGTGILKRWIYALFTVHLNMRGNTGGGLSMGRGFPVVTYKNQNLNTQSSTEAYIAGLYYCIPAVCWTRYFLEAHDYNVTENIVYQDNQSAILLEKNINASGSNRTNHKNLGLFFVANRINKKEVTVEWCPTNGTTGDFMTKPLQGNLFRKFRDLIMGVISTSK